MILNGKLIVIGNSDFSINIQDSIIFRFPLFLERLYDDLLNTKGK